MTSLEVLRLARNVLLRSFAVGYGITLLSLVCTLWGWHWWMPMVTGMFHADESAVTPLLLGFFFNAKLILVFGLLTPALACHWTLKREEAHNGR